MFMYVLLKEHVAIGSMHSCHSRKDMGILRIEKERELEAEKKEAIRIRVIANCASRDIF